MARKRVSLLARHPATWTPIYRAFVRRVMSTSVFKEFGACERFTEIVDEYMRREEAREKTYLFQSELESQRRIDAVCQPVEVCA